MPNREEIQIADGVWVERRLFLAAPVAAAVCAALGLDAVAQTAAAAGAATEPARPASLSWEQFLARGVPLARRMLDDPATSADELVLTLAALAVRLEAAPDTKLFPFGSLDPPVLFAPSYTGGPFVVIQWRLEPRAALPPHNHPNYAVCTVGLEGECRVRNYEVVGPAPEFSSTAPFAVRATHDELLARGRVNTLTPERDNIHRLEAGPLGARGVDIGVLYGKDVGFGFLRIADAPSASDPRRFEARWAEA